MKLEAKTEKEMHEVEAAWPKTEEDLISYIRSCLAAVNAPADIGDHEALGDAYGRCVYAISLAAVATFNYVAHVEGITGFQASCADLDILRRTRRLEGPFMIVDASKMLYPQYSDTLDRVKKFLESDDTKKWLKEKAKEQLDQNKDNEHVSVEVMAHWKKLAGAV